VICVYEDEELRWLSPLIELRPAFDLRCGRYTLLEKLVRLYPDERLALWVRDELKGMTAEAHPNCRVNSPLKNCRLLLSSRAILREPIRADGREAVLLSGSRVVGFRLSPARAARLDSLAGLDATLPEEQVKVKMVRYPWDLVEMNSGELVRELTDEVRSQRPGAKGQGQGRSEGTVAGDPNLLVVQQGARVWPGAVVSTETGPVYIDRGAQARPGSFVEGPCYVGPGTVIDGARVRPGCSFGPACRIGGEVEASIFHGFSNKHHEGFIGHSYVGEWVNLGAMTTNSDLKNTYEPVSVCYPDGPVETGLAKVGCFFGDHAKSAIGSLFNSGCRVGPFANWFEPGLARKELPAFSWGRHGAWSADAAVANARTVMARRKVRISPAYERAVRALHAASGVGRQA
jgi:UDP-N-acetylglucosamine diphosphorylase/glucosamine-1-phosphate N-acetyltransferase